MPSLIETPEDVANLPIVAGPNAVVRAQDLATVRSTYKDAETITRLDGKPAIAIEVKKRIGANLVETVDAVKAVADEFAKKLPEGSVVSYSQDKSTSIRQLLGDLQNHVMIAVILVFIIILYALSGRASMLIGLAIPTSFLLGILLLSLVGFTVNIVVLFSLILAVGMLVDDAIIVTEFAERRMAEGMDKKEAYALAANRMAGPVIAATMTRIAAFSPLLFWPGIVGEFMKYMPITLIVTLSASMLYALVFTPTLGAIFGKAHHEPEHKDGLYMGTVKVAVRHPIITMLLARGPAGRACRWSMPSKGNGVEFFPNVEPDYGLLYVHARGNLSLAEMDAAVGQAEKRILGWPGVKSVYTRAGKTTGGGNNVDEDVVGVIQYEFVDWRERKPAHEVLDELRAAMAGIPGVDVEVQVPEAGPPTGKAIQVRLSAVDPTGLNDKAREVAAMLKTIPGVIDVSDGLPPPGIDWALKIDRSKAAQYGVSPFAVGTVVQLVTTGLKLSDYRPAGADDAVDIRLRLPEDRRTLSTLDQLRVETAQGSVPISNFVTRQPEPKIGILNRIDGQRTIVVQANVASGVQPAAAQAQVTEAMKKMDLPGIRWKLAGQDEESKAAGDFLGKAFGAAMFLIFIVLLAQFNKFSSVMLVLSCVVMSTIGVFLGLLHHRPALRHRHVRHRRHRAGRRGGEQQHRADRHLRPAAPRRLGQDGGGAADLPRARAPGGADGAVGHLRRAADRLRPRAGNLPSRDDDQRAVDAVVDLAVERHRLRPVLRDGPDADRHAGDADGVHAQQGQPRQPLPRPGVPPRQEGRSGRGNHGAGSRLRRRCLSQGRGVMHPAPYAT